MELFETPAQENVKSSQPLAARMAPQDWEDFVGQEHLIRQGSALRRAIEADRLGSSIFFGPPGTGKTALARMAARKSDSAIEYVNAVTAGVAEIRQVVKRALDRKSMNGKRTLLIVDEIHHFNRSQQDALLPDVERGNLTLVGLTTENPYYYVNAALMSRSTAFEFKPLDDEALRRIASSALSDRERGFGGYKVNLSDEAFAHILLVANGDARRLLNSLELAVVTTPPDPDGSITVDLRAAEESSQKRSIRYDKKGDEHYDTISAFIKSMRGSDPDAAVYWMAKMLKAGEDPRFIARRMMIFAAEDIGNADPRALTVAASVAQVTEMVGMPEARIPLAQGATYLASAPKSNAAYLAVESAMDEVEQGRRRDVPLHLRDASRDSEALGHGKDYLYPHDYPGHFVPQTYLPDPAAFYRPTDQGEEAAISERLAGWRRRREEEARDRADDAD